MKIEIYYNYINDYDQFGTIVILSKNNHNYSWNMTNREAIIMKENFITLQKYESFVEKLSKFIDDNFATIKEKSKNKTWGIFDIEIDDLTEEELFYIKLKKE